MSSLHFLETTPLSPQLCGDLFIIEEANVTHYVSAWPLKHARGTRLNKKVEAIITALGDLRILSACILNTFCLKGAKSPVEDYRMLQPTTCWFSVRSGKHPPSEIQNSNRNEIWEDSSLNECQ